MATQSPYLAQSLKDKGYIGVTGSTPYRPPTPQETAALQNIYQDTSVTTVPKTVAPGAIALNVNFDGTHNNGRFPAAGESATNIYHANDPLDANFTDTYTDAQGKPIVRITVEYLQPYSYSPTTRKPLTDKEQQ